MSDTPRCKATQEALLEAGLDILSECPACLDFNVHCRIACHPRRGGESVEGRPKHSLPCVAAVASPILFAASFTVHPRSPAVTSSSVYFICVLLDDDVLAFSGTAFAATTTRVVTALHNICENRKAALKASSSTQTHIFRECVLVKSLHRRLGAVTYPTEQIRVRLVVHDVGDDWAVLERVDGEVFEDFIHVCPDHELPHPSSDTSLTAYYAPLSFINDIDAIKRLKVWSEPTLLLQYDDGDSADDKFAIVSNGKVQGALGSPIVTADGKALAFHTYSFNEQCRKSRDDDIGTATAGEMTTPQLMALKEHVDDELSGLKSEIDSTRSHADYSRAIVICKTAGLMTALLLT